MKVRIFQPSKTAMQSGRGKTDGWVLQYESPSPKVPEGLMGWISSGDTLGQVSLMFKDQQAAINYAQERGWSYDLQSVRGRRVRPRNYADNFKYKAPKN